MRGFSIGKLARAARVSIDTIRYYERSGLLRSPARRPSGYREYSEVDLRHLRCIRSARQLGFSLEEIAELLSLDTVEERAAVRTLVLEKLTHIDSTIHELKRWRSSLLELIREPANGLSQPRSIVEVLEGASVEEVSLSPDSMPAHLREIHDEV